MKIFFVTFQNGEKTTWNGHEHIHVVIPRYESTFITAERQVEVIEAIKVAYPHAKQLKITEATVCRRSDEPIY